MSCDDLFICGKCHTNFTDLNIFLTHRSTCADQQTTNLCPISSCPLSTLVSSDFETLVEDISSNLLSPSISTDIRQCPVCNEQFESQAILENHVFEHSIYGNLIDDTSFECKQCDLTFTSKSSLAAHNTTQHGLNAEFCCFNKNCSQLFEKPIDYILHAQVHSQKQIVDSRHHRNRQLRRIYRCKICKITFPTSDRLEYHMKYEKHQLFCEICSIEFESSNSYHNHLARHGQLAPYPCAKCTKAFQKRADLSRHIVTEHKDDISDDKTCSICELTFTARFHLKRHNATKHSDIKPYKCKQQGCEKTFARKDKLQQHEVKHDASVRMNQCQVCSKTFVRPEHLRHHTIIKHSHQYPISCEHCGKGFLHQTQLYDHYKHYHSIIDQTRS